MNLKSLRHKRFTNFIWPNGQPPSVSRNASVTRYI